MIRIHQRKAHTLFHIRFGGHQFSRVETLNGNL